jgi:hypothetical protein
MHEERRENVNKKLSRALNLLARHVVSNNRRNRRAIYYNICLSYTQFAILLSSQYFLKYRMEYSIGKYEKLIRATIPISIMLMKA